MEITPFEPTPATAFKTVKPVLRAAQWDGTREDMRRVHVALVEVLEPLAADVVRANARLQASVGDGIHIEYEIQREADGLIWKFSVYPMNWIVVWEGAGWVQDIEVLGASDGDVRFSAPILRLPTSPEIEE